MSNLEEDDTSLATSKAASSTSDSSNSEEEMDTDAGLSVSSLQDPDMALHPTHSKSSVDSSLTSPSLSTIYTCTNTDTVRMSGRVFVV